MFLALRAVLTAIVIFVATFFGAPVHVTAPTVTLPAALPDSTTTPAVNHSTSTPTTSSGQATTTKKGAPKSPDVLTPGTPEYQKSLQSALDALTKLQASTSTPNSTSDAVRAAVVNIICTTERGGSVNPISASGVIIDPRGIVLTNAHVGQYFLLKDYPSPNFIQCIIRTGSPARPGYTAKLLYLPPDWIADNASKIVESAPTGTGEHDYALLVMTGVTGPSVPVPTSFPYLPLATTEPVLGSAVTIAGYPAGFLGGITIQMDLYESSAASTIGTLYTFATVSPDLFSVGGTILSQHGSSGGAVARNGALQGLVVTATDAPETSARDLRAIASTYIIRDFQSEDGVALADFLAGDILSESVLFNAQIAPTLTKELVDVLNH